jgi:hypothetical protein
VGAPEPESESESVDDGAEWWAGFIQPLLVTTLVPLAATPGIAAVTAIFTDFGRSVSPEFYSALAQVLPVILLTVLVERFAFEQRREPFWIEQRRDHQGKIDPGKWLDLVGVRWATTLWLGLNFAIGEAAALYGLATEGSSTFVFMLSVIPIALLFGVLFFYHLGRYVPIEE